jgi:hypothetical protein
MLGSRWGHGGGGGGLSVTTTSQLVVAKKDYDTFQVSRYSRVGFRPSPQTLDKAGKVLQGQRV